MLRTFFTVVRVLCERSSSGAPHTKVTLQFSKDGNWRVDRSWYHVDDVAVEYPGMPLHVVEDEVPDIDCHMRKLLGLDGDLTARCP